MADIKGRTIATTYGKLLYTSTDDGLVGNTGSTTSVVTTDDMDGTSTASCLNLGIDRVGIGTDSPGSLLEVRGGTGGGLPGGAGILTLSTGEVDHIVNGDVLGLISFSAPVETSGSVGQSPAAAIWAEAEADFTSSVNSSSLVFAAATDATAHHSDRERMRITYEGNVGIGTTVPDQTLTIANATDPHLSIMRYDASAISDTEILGSITFGGSVDSGANFGYGAAIRSYASENWDFSASDYGGDLQFCTTANTTSTLSPRMTILDTGSVGIGTTSPDGTLHIVSSAEGAFADSGTVTPQLIVEGTGSTAGSTSPFVVLHNSSAAVDNDFIGKVSFTGDDETGDATGDLSVGTEYASIFCRILDATDNTTDGALYFATDVNDTKTDTMVLTGGNVGIGTASPQTGLQVQYEGGALDGSWAATAASAAITISANSPSALGTSTRLALGVGAATYTYLQSQNASDDGEKHLVLNPVGGNVGIGTDSPASLLELAQGSADTNILEFTSSDISHSMTGLASADAYGAFLKASSNDGGLAVCGYNDTQDNGALLLVGRTEVALNATKSASGHGSIRVVAQVRSGASASDPASNANLFSVDHGGNSVRFIVDADGDLFCEGGAGDLSGAGTTTATTYDAYDDAQLVRTLDLSYGKGRGLINGKFDEFVKYNHEKLAELNLVGREKDGTPNHFINVTGMQRLHNGAIWQQYTEMQKMKELMYDTMVELMGKDKADKKLASYDVKLLDEGLLN